MMMVAVMPAYRLCQILDVRKLIGLRCLGEVFRELGQLAGRGAVALRLSRLGRTLQIGGDLLSDLLILGRIGLLKLLKFTEHLGERGKLSIIGLG